MAAPHPSHAKEELRGCFSYNPWSWAGPPCLTLSCLRSMPKKQAPSVIYPFNPSGSYCSELLPHVLSTSHHSPCNLSTIAHALRKPLVNSLLHPQLPCSKAHLLPPSEAFPQVEAALSPTLHPSEAQAWPPASGHTTLLGLSSTLLL